MNLGRFFICLLLLALSNLAFAQKRAIKKFKKAEQQFVFHTFDMEDYERAYPYLETMLKVAERKFERQDSFYATAKLSELDYWVRQKYFLKADSLLKPELEWLEQAIDKKMQLDRRHYSYYLFLGNIHVNLGIAEKEENQIIEDPLPKWARTDKGRYESALKHFNIGIEAYENLAKYRPDHPDYRHNLTVTWREKGELQGRYLGDLDACIQSLEKATSYQQDLETLRLLGVAYGMKGVHSKAIESFKKGLELDDRNLAILYNLEIAYRQLAAINQGDKAIEYSEMADSYQIKWRAIDPNYQSGG